MAKKRVSEVDRVERYAALGDFFKIVAEIKTPKEASNFFKDLLTPSESLMLTRRIVIAKMLLEGWNFEDISKKLKAGTNTVNSVNRWLYTGFGGYLNELKKIKSKKEFRDQFPTTEWARLKKNYPAHFLIANLLEKFSK